jgi:hypothetical protein
MGFQQISKPSNLEVTVEVEPCYSNAHARMVQNEMALVRPASMSAFKDPDFRETSPLNNATIEFALLRAPN